MAISKLVYPAKENAVQEKINEIIDGLGGGGTIVVDQTFDGTSINPQSGVAIAGELANYTPTSGLATVATTGSYDDLLNKPDVYSRNIGEIVTSTLPLNDAGLHLLDGTLLSGSGIYAAFVDYIADIYDDNNYPDLFVTEAAWQTSVTNNGVCGKFVYDSINNTVRLPKITGIIEGTTSLTALGDLVAAGLPNITGAFNTYILSGATSSNYWTLPSGGHTGAFAPTSTSRVTRPYYNSAGTSTATWNYGSEFDASASNSIYGNSSKVQPQTIKVLYYIVVATTTKTDIQVDIDDIATDLNSKVDKTGDTMTGNLTMSDSNILIYHDNTNPVIVGKRGDVRTGDIPGEAKRLIQVAGYDCDNTSLGLLQNYIGASGNTIMELAVRNSGNAWASVLLSQTTDGTSYFSFPRCTTAATTTSTASDSKVAVVVQNYKNGNSWYRVWSDGWIEQGSMVQTTSTSYTVSFIKTFATRNYTFLLTPCSSSATDTGGIGTSAVPRNPTTSTRTVSSTQLSSPNGVYVYWYACGY